MRKAIIFFFITIILVVTIIFSWFSQGKMIVNGSEENFNIFHSQKNAENASSFWRSVGTGYKTSFLIPTYSVFAVLGWMEKMGSPAFIRQASLLSTLMVVGIFSTYLLIRIAFNLGNTAAYIGGIFYYLNIYTLTQVWKRFIYSHMFAWAYLPLFTFLWIKWISTRKVLWLFFFLASSLFFTFAFSNPVFLLTIWTPALIFVLVQLWDERKKRKQFVQTIIYSLIGLSLWSIINIWWLYPTLTLGGTWTAQTGQTWQSDLSSLHAVSKYFPIGEIMLLRQSWYLGHENDWFDFYHNPFIYLISLIVLFIAIWGFIKIKDLTAGKYLSLLAIVGLFISKGTSSPFGYTFFEILFSNFPLTAALRNSYEKFGIVWLLPYTILFAVGFDWIFYNLKGFKRYLVGGLIILFSLGVLVFPMWTGAIFPARHRLNVPDYYKEANDYLKKLQVTDNRIFHIPSLIELDRVTYSWGFIGEDPSDNLFDSEVLSKPGSPGLDPAYKLVHKYLYERDTSKLLGFLGVENIILHKDNIYPKIDVNDVQNRIERWENIRGKQDFGKLTAYTLNNEIVKPRIYVATSVKLVSSMEEGVRDILDGKIDASNTIFVTENSNSIPETQYSIKPIFRMEKKSSTWYKVEIKNATDPFILVLNNTFDKSWQMTINEKIIEPHFIANGFVNGWILKKEGDYTAEIKLVVWPWDKKS